MGATTPASSSKAHHGVATYWSTRKEREFRLRASKGNRQGARAARIPDPTLEPLDWNRKLMVDEFEKTRRFECVRREPQGI